MTLPTIHPNGTPARMLAASAEAAYEALQTAYELLRQTAPNECDYPTQPDGTFIHARTEHAARLYKLTSVMNDLEILLNWLNAEGA